MPIRKLRETLLGHVRCVYPELPEARPPMLSCPPDPEMGDLALQCFPLAKALRRSPQQIAAELAEAGVDLPGFCRTAQTGPYVNFFLDPVALAQTVLDQVREQAENYGHLTVGAGRTVVIDYSLAQYRQAFRHRPPALDGHRRSAVPALPGRGLPRGRD